MIRLPYSIHDVDPFSMSVARFVPVRPASEEPWMKAFVASKLVVDKPSDKRSIEIQSANGWCPMAAPPLEEGVYRVRSKKIDTRWFSRWANGQWHMTCDSVNCAKTAEMRSSDCYDDNLVSGWSHL